jgi:hypothetical protein
LRESDLGVSKGSVEDIAIISFWESVLNGSIAKMAGGSNKAIVVKKRTVRYILSWG